jgi:signal transduction histidine kinase
MSAMRGGHKLTTTLIVTGVFLLAVGLIAIWFVGQLNAVLDDIGTYDYQLERVGEAQAGFHIEPDKLTSHLARVSDIQKFAHSDFEQAKLQEATAALAAPQTAASIAPRALDELAAYYLQASVKAHQRLVVLHRRAVLGIIVIMIDSVILLIVLMAQLRRWFVEPMEIFSASLKRVATGDHSEPVTPMDQPEFAEMVQSLQTLSQTVQQLQDRLEKTEKMATVGQACTHVAHNLHDMLASIRSIAQYEGDAAHVDPNAKVAFEYIIGTVNKMDTWVGDVMHSVRPVELRLASQQVEPILHNVLAMLQPQLKDRGIAVDLQPGDDLPNVSADRGLIERALIAVFCNAIDASPDGGRISVRTEKGNDGTVAIHVQDQGAGIVESVRQRAFEPFFTTKPDAPGLGLTIALNIVKRHHGSIEIDSQGNDGTRVRIELPAVKTTNGAAA